MGENLPEPSHDHDLGLRQIRRSCMHQPIGSPVSSFNNVEVAAIQVHRRSEHSLPLFAGRVNLPRPQPVACDLGSTLTCRVRCNASSTRWAAVVCSSRIKGEWPDITPSLVLTWGVAQTDPLI